MKCFLSCRNTLALLFSLTFYLPLEAQLSFNVEKTYDWEFDGSSTDQWPDIIGHGEDYIITRCVRLKSFKGFVPSIEKRSISTGEVLYELNLKEKGFRNLDVIYEDAYFENGNVHLLYRTEMKNKDSLYLLDQVITPEGELHEPHVLIAGWMAKESVRPNMRFSWNETRTSLTAIALQENKKGEAVYVRRKFNEQLQLIESDIYEAGNKLENVNIIEYKELGETSYLFAFISEGNGGATKMVRLNKAGITSIDAGVQHRNISGINLHSQGEDICLSYLSFEDEDRKNIEGYKCSVVDFEGHQKWVTNYSFDKNFLNHVNAFDSWAHKDRGRFSIKQVLEHPKGGYLLTLHKTYSLETSNSFMITYYSNDHIILYINPSSEVVWVQFIPSRMSSVNTGQLNNFTGFTTDGSYVEFIMNNPENTDDWNAGETRARLMNQTALTAAIVSPDGKLNFKNLNKGESGLIVPATSNMSRINPDSRGYYMFQVISGADSQLVKVSIDGLDRKGKDPVYSVLKYGKQK